MGIVFLFWSVLALIIVVYVCVIMGFVRKSAEISTVSEYSEEVIEKTKSFVNAINSGKIKKHIITNSAKKYDSKKALRQYRSFLSSELMTDIMRIEEEIYHG